MKDSHVAEGPHPVPNISKFSVGGNLAGLIIAVSIIVLGLIGLPQTRWLLGGAVVLGGAYAVFLRWREH